MEGLLSQWNYWCTFMNLGPEDLPAPALYFAETENNLESFLFCMYELGYNASSFSRTLFMPVIIFLTCFRLLAKWSCRRPIWPAWIEKLCIIEPNDPYDQPRGETPIGWAKTAMVRENVTVAGNDRRKLPAWTGEKNGEKNARLWAADRPPPIAGIPLDHQSRRT